MRIESSLGFDIKSFWKFTNSARGISGLPNVMSFRNSLADNGQDIVDMFATYFESVYVEPDNDNSDDELIDNYTYSDINISKLEITQMDVFEAIEKLNGKIGPGPDGLPSSFLKNCRTNITPILHYLFNKFLNEGTFPSIWKRSFITPIHKANERSDISNYRPISKLSTIPKLFESIVTNKLSGSLGNLLIDEQHGFRPKRSTTTNLLTFQHYTLEKLEKNAQVDVIYTDFSKVFDSVNHKMLLKKLKYLGIHGILLKWIENYLVDRLQNVKYKSFISKDINVKSGVPQGSHLGPLLFILFINDIKFKLSSCSFLMYADDLKLYSEIKSLQDCITLQLNLDSLVSWCNVNKLQLNILKCKIMTFSRMRSNINFQYSINGEILETVSLMKDLGVLFDSKLKFSDHIDQIITKATRLLGFIRRMTTNFTNPKSFRTLYLTLVRPILLYASSVWSPIYENHSKKLERIQHKFLNFVAWKLRLPSPRISHDYNQIASLLDISSLKSHRYLNDLKFLYNLINNEIDCIHLHSKLLLRVPKINLRNRECNNFVVPIAKTNQFYHAPLWRMCNLADSLNIEFYSNEKCINQIKRALLIDYS